MKKKSRGIGHDGSLEVYCAARLLNKGADNEQLGLFIVYVAYAPFFLFQSENFLESFLEKRPRLLTTNG